MVRLFFRETINKCVSSCHFAPFCHNKTKYTHHQQHSYQIHHQLLTKHIHIYGTENALFQRVNKKYKQMI